MNDTAAEECAAREFAVSTADHQMTVLHDDGVYRHLRFAKPGTGIYRFDLVTWPGHLSITGDLESFTFAREHDMFGFFAHDRGRIKPHYWAQKIVATSVVREWSPEAFRSAVVRYFWERRGTVANARSLFREVREEVLDWQAEDAESAHQAIDSFYSLDARQFRFEGLDLAEFTEYSIHYLRALHAIAWGIAKYRKEAAA